jgi:hypothetical protein
LHLSLLQACWWDSSALAMLPGVDAAAEAALAQAQLGSLGALLAEARAAPGRARAALERALGSARAAQECLQVCNAYKIAMIITVPRSFAALEGLPHVYL